MKQVQVKEYRFGFSPYGLLAIVLVMIPNIIWAIAPPANNPLVAGVSAFPVLDIVENIFRFATMILLAVLVFDGHEVNLKSKPVVLAAVFLTFYYLFWIVYFFLAQGYWVMLGLALAPVFFFAAIAYWLKNYPALVASILFGLVHLAITAVNYF